MKNLLTQRKRHHRNSCVRYWMAILIALSLAGGCTLPNRQFQPPRPIGLQQMEATQWDPYADVDGAPEIVGARPRDFQRPASEAVRARSFRESSWQF